MDTTPRPRWHVNTGNGKVMEGNERHVATMRPSCVNHLWMSDASLIVRAVNAHDDLVAACEAARRSLGYQIGADESLNLRAVLDKALAKAKVSP
jgi:hypothetical protein